MGIDQQKLLLAIARRVEEISRINGGIQSGTTSELLKMIAENSSPMFGRAIEDFDTEKIPVGKKICFIVQNETMAGIFYRFEKMAGGWKLDYATRPAGLAPWSAKNPTVAQDAVEFETKINQNEAMVDYKMDYFGGQEMGPSGRFKVVEVPTDQGVMANAFRTQAQTEALSAAAKAMIVVPEVLPKSETAKFAAKSDSDNKQYMIYGKLVGKLKILKPGSNPLRRDATLYATMA